MDDDSRVIDKGWDALPEYGSQPGDADDAVTVSISTTPGEWLVNTVDAVVVPMSMAEVVEALQNHKLTERSLVWRAGMPEWAAVDKVPQLKLAARMPLSVPSTSPRRPTPAAGTAPTALTATVAPTRVSKPPPKPVRATSAPPAAQPAPHSMPSRRATLPFGLPAPLAAQSRPSSPRPSSSPRHGGPPSPTSDEPDVLAVYARPAATISFDLAPVEPRRTTSTAPPTPLQTLAPTTTDSAQRRVPVPRHADLSVVAASDFRQVQRSSKRLVWASSLASAAAASLLTFALARGSGSSAPSTPVRGNTLAAAQPVAAPTLSAATVAAPVTPSPEPAVAVPEPPTPASKPSAAPAPKPKAARKARAVSAARPLPKTDTGAAPRDPASEPNPYDVKLEEEPAAAKPASSAAHGSGLEPDGDAPQASSNGSASPGF